MTTHPHLDGLIRKVEHLSICLMEPQINLLPQPAPQVIERYADQVNEILIALKALAALPGGGVDEAMVERGAEAFWNMVPRGVPWAEATNCGNDWRRIARTILTAALSPTPTPHEADRNG